MRTWQYGNWYQEVIQKGQNRIRRSWVGYCFKEKKSRKNKNKNREELGGYGFHDKLHLKYFFFDKCVTLKICQINGLYR